VNRSATPVDRPQTCPEPGRDSLRDSGLRLIGEIGWGAHICVFYETKSDLLDTAAAFFKAGLASNELCVWAISNQITIAEAERALRSAIPEFEKYLADGKIELIDGTDWYLEGDEFNLKRVTEGWVSKLNAALKLGYDGMRVSGDAFWIRTKHWDDFCLYEKELDKSFSQQKMIALCTYSLSASTAADILDVVRTHRSAVIRREHDWKVLDGQESRNAGNGVGKPPGAHDILPNSLPGQEDLTPRERLVLAQIVGGASSKEAARILGVSRRTIDFHRANLLRKRGARNTVDLVRRAVRDV
jgi:DNA-binding CsgD family transcriptional regulator